MTTITLSLDDTLAHQLRDVAEQQLLSDEELLRRALQFYLRASATSRRTFAELYGVWQGVQFSEEDIRADEYRADPNLGA